jgi:GT2 family glycosyltransferase
MRIYPKISIITVNYRQSGVTNELVSSLHHVRWPDFEVIIVDNSENGDHRKLYLPDSRYTLIVSKKNKGFAAANNLGMAAARGEYILLLNNDTEVDPGFLAPMVRLFETNPLIGAVSPKIKYFHNPELIQYAGYSRMNPITLRVKGFGYRKTDDGRFDRISQTNYAHGCAMMVSRKAIETVGMMPEEYFLYYEEQDWSFSIRKNGFQIWYQPESVVWHKESMSVKPGSPLKTYYMNRNRVLFMKKNLNFVQQIMSSIYLLMFSIPANTMKYIIRRDRKHLNAYWDGVIWNINHKTKTKWK